MKWFTEAIGIVLCIQGVGGGLSALLEGGRSWFLVRYVVPGGAQVAVAAVLALVGVLVLVAGSRKRQYA
ncbi:hypothetical protein [Actinophytocola glycyrrhizae]|uniref:GlsB/YeaQ/YmgE family stress response membrane protein n=1 Tax=Actinophytocola glycyrrhizae TaxID=2044873 RepID=A0ABV9S4P7_9PSEU